jgi:radical SAM protein with 4Fe4S-binding SPASM domain
MDFCNLPQTPYAEFSKRVHHTAASNRIPLNGSISLTQRCNLHCAHCYCYIDSSLQEMDYDQVCRILDDIADAGCFWLLLTGGEPLLRPDFLDIYTYAKKKGFIITLFTNGTLLTSSVADYLKEYPPFSIEITLYGATKETYEKVTGVRGSFERCYDGIARIIDRKLLLKLKATVSTLNQHEISQMQDFAYDLNVDFRFDAVLIPTLNGSMIPSRYRLAPEHAVALDVADEKKSNAWRQLCTSNAHLQGRQRLFMCMAGINSFHIDSFGVLRPCEMVRPYKYDLHANTFNEAWNSMENKVLENVQGTYKCKNCSMGNVCDQCPGWSFLEHDQPARAVDYLCQIAHIRAKAFGVNSVKLRRKEMR